MLEGEGGAWSLVTLMTLAGQEGAKGEDFTGLTAAHPDLPLTGKQSLKRSSQLLRFSLEICLK